MKPSEQEIKAAIKTLNASGYGIIPPKDMGVWRDAPEWAKYRATDADGTINFYQFKPILQEDEFVEAWDIVKDHHVWEADQNQTVFEECENWKESLIKRPR